LFFAVVFTSDHQKKKKKKKRDSGGIKWYFERQELRPAKKMPQLCTMPKQPHEAACGCAAFAQPT
jgi:hypothetical protein